MSVHDPAVFPPPPRSPAWFASLRVRWPLAAAGAVAVAAGTFVTERGLARETAIGAVVLPGIALVMLWLRGVMRYRVLLTSGEITTAVVAGGRYAFRDRSGREIRGRIRGTPADGPVAIVFDADDPRIHRVVSRTDFTAIGDSG